MSKRKNPSNIDNLNDDFCDFLMELADYEKNISRNVHKYNAYRKAASVLASHNKRIESGDEAKKLNGIGDKIAKKIDEFLLTGKLRKLEKIHNDEDAQVISLLTRVSGIGPVKAADLASKGIKTLEDLQKNEKDLNHHQLIGLKYFQDFEKKIPREEIVELETIIRKRILDLDPEYTITICGSYRRGLAQSGDIDALVTHPSLENDREKLGAKLLKNITAALGNLITDVISMGVTKFMGVCRLSECHLHRRLDVRVLPPAQFYCGVLYFTGSDVFNKTLRAHALQQGFTLNEYALRPIGVTGVPGAPVTVSSEEDVFEYIQYPYKTPEDRNL